MGKLRWVGRIGLLGLGLILLPADVDEAGITRSALCAAEDAQCKVEVGSYCAFEGVPYVDLAPKNAR